MEPIVIVMAGGMGSRFGGTVPKQLARLADKTVLAHTLEVFEGIETIEKLVVVANPKWLSEIKFEATNACQRVSVEVVAGGITRNDSLRNAINTIEGGNAKILIHDAVRPLVNQELVHRVLEKLTTARSVLPVIKSSDLLVATAHNSLEFLNRESVFRGQTPQGFWLDDLRNVFAEIHDHITLNLTTVYEAVRAVDPTIDIQLVEGLEENIKITLPVDHMLAQRLIEDRDRDPGSAGHAAPGMLTLPAEPQLVVADAV